MRPRLYAAKGLQDGVYLGIIVGRGGEVFGDALAVEDVPDLADRHDRVARILYTVEVGLRGRCDAVVVAVLVLALVGARLAVEGRAMTRSTMISPSPISILWAFSHAS